VDPLNDSFISTLKAAMPLIPQHRIRPSLWAGQITLLALAACTSHQFPLVAPSHAAVPNADVISPWPEPTAPLETTPIGPVESAGAAANG
jgi:hypothetical protein